MGTPPHDPTVLLVEDDPDLLELMARVVQLAAASATTITVENAADALTILAQQPIALLITDYHLEGMDGIELTAAIKAISPTTHVIMLTAYASGQLAQQAKDAGADAFLAKPFTIEQLMVLVRAALADDEGSGGSIAVGR